MEPVKAECSSCRATGLYRGFAEPEGVGVVCINCEGTGCRTISTPGVTYTPFTERKRRNDVKIVKLSRGTFIGTGVGPGGRGISYEEFLAGKMP
jgi:hypothetical protein